MRITSRLVSFASRRTSWSEGHVFTIAPEQINIVEGLRAALGMAITLGASIYFHIHDLAFAAVAVFWTFLCDPVGPDKMRAQIMVQFALLGALALSLGAYAASWGPYVAGPCLFLLVFACGMTRTYKAAFGPMPAQGGLIAAVAVVIGIASPRDLDGSIWLAAYFLLGAGLAIVSALYVWPTRSMTPGRQMLVAIFSRLDEMLSDLEKLDALPNATDGEWTRFNTVYRRAARISLERGRAIVARMVGDRARYGRGIDAAGRTFSAIIALGHYRRESGKPFDRSAEMPLIQALRESLRLLVDQSDRARPDTQALATHLERVLAEAKASDGLVARSVWFAADALHEFLFRLDERGADRNSVVVPGSGTPRGINAIVWRHSLRVSLAVLICYCIGIVFDVSFSYWGAITTLVVMQPIVGNTWLRVLERAVGSVMGGCIAAVLIWQVTGVGEMAAVIVVLSVAVIALRLVNYGVFVLFLTPMFMLLSDYLRPSDGLILARVINESLGACLGLLASVLLWPDRTANDLRGAIAAAVEANFAFACAVLRLRDGDRLDSLQRDAGVASALVETASERLWLEGRGNSARFRKLEAVTGALRSLCGAAAVLEITRAPEADEERARRYEKTSVDLQATLASASAAAPYPLHGKTDDDLERSADRLVAAIREYAGKGEPD